MKKWNRPSDRLACMAHFGSMSQLCGLRRSVLSDGKAAGVEAIDINTGAGLEFTVLPGRGMDIAWTRYAGVPVSYITKAGVTHPAYHDRRESEWLRSFFGGLLTTCGMQNAGPDCRDTVPVLGDRPYNVHGDATNTAADNVCAREEWIDGKYTMTVSGRIEEGRLHGEHLSMRREITTQLSEQRFFLHDSYCNEGDTEQPLMFFYHINIGHPILSDGSRFLAPSKRVWCSSDVAKAGLSEYDQYGAPRSGYLEQQFYHEMASDAAGNTVAALVNDELELGFYIRYNVKELPCIAQWKLLRNGEYVHAFEPGNCHPVGRAEQKKRNALEILQPTQTHEVHMEIGILDGASEIESLRQEIARY